MVRRTHVCARLCSATSERNALACPCHVCAFGLATPLRIRYPSGGQNTSYHNDSRTSPRMQSPPTSVWIPSHPPSTSSTFSCLQGISTISNKKWVIRTGPFCVQLFNFWGGIRICHPRGPRPYPSDPLRILKESRHSSWCNSGISAIPMQWNAMFSPTGDRQTEEFTPSQATPIRPTRLPFNTSIPFNPPCSAAHKR